MPRVIAALNLPRRIPDAIVYAQSVAAALDGNPAFPSPRPPLATFKADVAALDAAHVRTLTRALGTAAERDARLETVVLALSSLRRYVQHVANASPGEAEAIIASAGMSVKRSSGHPKPAFEAKQGPVSGTALLVAKAPKTRASYDWQSSLDGIVWVDLERTMRADTAVSGLVACNRYLFRYRVLKKDGVGDFSDAVSLLVG
jgi:hypothetical protein